MSSNNDSRLSNVSMPFCGGKGKSVAYEEQQQQQTHAIMDAENNLRLMKEELDNIPDNMKPSFLYAQHAAPDLLCDQHLSRFLYAEGYNAKLAAKRVVNYWEHRKNVFGDEYILPLTLFGAMKNHVQSLHDGFLSLLPLKDNFGRAIIFSNPIKLSPSKFHNQIRIWWYLIHVAMDDDEALRNGFIIVSNARNTSLTNFDARSTAAICTSDRIFPIRWRQTHCCHTNPVFPLVASMVKSVLSQEQRESFVLHNGTCEQVIESFRVNGVPKECLPTDMGGSIVLSPELFIRERLATEGCFKLEKSDDASQLRVTRPENVVGSSVDTALLVPEKKPHAQVKKPKKKASSTATKQSVQPGRPGDPRMNAAVQAKLEDPDLPLLEALAVGGFIFEDINKPGVKSSEVRDKDGVTVYQRRNQLLRRLRKERKKAQS